MNNQNQNQKHYIGLDVSKAKIDVSIAPKKHFIIENSPKGFAELFAEVKKLEAEKKLAGTPFFVLEETGIYGIAFRLAAEKAKFEYACVSAFCVKHFKLSENQLAKTDKIDAEMIRLFGEQKDPQASRLPAKIFIKLRELQNLAYQLTKMTINLENLLEATTLPECQREIKRVLDAAEKRIDKLEKKMEEIIKKDPEMALKRSSLLEVYGVGKVIADLLVIRIPKLGEMGRREIAAFIGCAPKANDSGAHNGKRKCSGNKNRIRVKLYMPVMTAAGQKGSPLKAFHDRLEARGITGNRLRICCTRKFIQYLNAKVARDLAAFRSRNSAELAA